MKQMQLLQQVTLSENPPVGISSPDVSCSVFRRHPAWLAFIATTLFSLIARADSPQDWIRSHREPLVELYRQLHAHPELSLMERETARRIREHLRAAGYEVTSEVGGFGVVGLLRNGPGPVIMIRCDLDALPITEQTELIYASRVKMKDSQGNEVGVMHACGHDLHMTTFVGTSQYLATHRDQWQGTVMFVAQPAEERGGGARAMLAAGLFTKFPTPDAAIALHTDATLATGLVGLRGGYILANVDSLDITVKGRGGHGAHPHRTVDPIVQAAELILSLQTLVSREIKPTEPAVVTVGSIHGGTQYNIIGSSCHLQLTVRSYSDEVRKQLLAGIERKAKAIALAHNAPEPEIRLSEGTPALRNDDRLAERLSVALKRKMGADCVVDAEPSMGGEDFSEYGKAGVPLLMFRLGAVNASRLERYKQLGQDPPSLHSPLFYPDAEEAISTGVPALSNAALELLQSGAGNSSK